VGGGNELLWQLTGGTETMRVTRIVPHDRHAERDDDDGDSDRDGDDEGITALGRDLDVLPNNHGPQTVSSTASGRSAATTAVTRRAGRRGFAITLARNHT
jgi:hypothetical protein